MYSMTYIQSTVHQLSQPVECSHTYVWIRGILVVYDIQYKYPTYGETHSMCVLYVLCGHIRGSGTLTHTSVDSTRLYIRVNKNSRTSTGIPRFDSTGMTYYHSVLQRWTCIIPWCNYHINYTCHTLNVLIWGLSLQCLCCIGVLDYWNTNVYLYCIRLHTIVKAHTTSTAQTT